jgi:hypothetical protein
VLSVKLLQAQLRRAQNGQLSETAIDPTPTKRAALPIRVGGGAVLSLCAKLIFFSSSGRAWRKLLILLGAFVKT